MSFVRIAKVISATENIEDLVDIMVSNLSDEQLQDASDDAIMIEKLFPLLKDWDKRTVISLEELEQFIKSIDFEAIGVEPHEVQEILSNKQSIGEILKAITSLMSKSDKEESVKEHLINTYYKRNCNSDINCFKETLNLKYWNLN